MKRLLVLLLVLSFVNLACLQTAMVAESAPVETVSEVVPTGTATEIYSGAVWDIPTASAYVCAKVVAVRSLYLRSAPDVNSESVSFMWNGELVRVLGSSNPDWWNVDHAGVFGYARSKYLEIVECE